MSHEPLINRENIGPPTVVEGDAGIVLKPDGSFRIFNTIDFSKPLSPESRELGCKLLVLAAVLNDPDLQQKILDVVPADLIQGMKLDS